MQGRKLGVQWEIGEGFKRNAKGRLQRVGTDVG